LDGLADTRPFTNHQLRIYFYFCLVPWPSFVLSEVAFIIGISVRVTAPMIVFYKVISKTQGAWHQQSSRPVQHEKGFCGICFALVCVFSTDFSESMRMWRDYAYHACHF